MKYEFKFGFNDHRSSTNTFLLLALGVHLATFSFSMLETILVLIIYIK